jgi:hypothetical protein
MLLSFLVVVFREEIVGLFKKGMENGKVRRQAKKVKAHGSYGVVRWAHLALDVVVGLDKQS